MRNVADSINFIKVVAKTASDALVERKELESRLKELEEQCKTPEISEDELARSFKQAREMLKSGELSTVKALIERCSQLLGATYQKPQQKENTAIFRGASFSQALIAREGCQVRGIGLRSPEDLSS